MNVYITIDVVGDSMIKSIPAAFSQVVRWVELFLKNAVDCRNRICRKIGSPFNKQDSISGFEVSNTVSCRTSLMNVQGQFMDPTTYTLTPENL